MKPTLTILVFLIFCLIAQAANAQQSSDLNYKTYRVTLFPGLSTNGVDAPNYSAKYSLNILGGYHGALEGYEVGVVNVNRFYTEGLQFGAFNASGGYMSGVNFASLANYAREDMQGVQFAGLGNITEGTIQGVQFAGLVNSGVIGMQGLQFAGIANIASGNIEGIQGAGIVNAGTGDMQGIMMAGVGNFSSGYAQGIIISGILNVAYEMQGISLAGIVNAGSKFQGIQIAGITNITRQGEGVQLGLVNIAQNFDGVPVGLISLYGDGRKNVDIWTSEVGTTNVGLKLGTIEIYNMIFLGYNSALNNEDLWTFGWTIGSHKSLDEAWNNERFEGYFRMNDFTIQSLQDNDGDFWDSRMISFRYLLGKEISRGLGIYAGPALNFLISDDEDERDYSLYSIIERERGGQNLSIWIGLSAGIQIF